ncbi:TetR/AcrR family transcriptional regulator [Pigmentiphaga aceris]|uniref:TetR/AcrR family transcriptional regulator n=2 Tax=Pigmentiphaga aceris TaxID=1940612 RepID=A0A5C0B806_9BURK|nr:TetR/AcrR family transcriptional regulator [Pigmentiphaga aceris]
MGRRKTIDWDAVLEAAERVSATQGSSAMTIDGVAEAAGISKGGVQSCYANKEALIEAMLDRWALLYDSQIEQVGVRPGNGRDAINAHVTVTANETAASRSKSAALFGALLQSPDPLKWTQAWYAKRVADIDLRTSEGRGLRLAFLATEGVFLLRFCGFIKIDEDEWKDIFEDIKGVLG